MTEAEFSAALTELLDDDTPKALAIAVSGGGDSMALLHLAADWAKGAGCRIHAVTVDHGLRHEAAAEAELVARAAASLNLRHSVLRWDGWDGTGNLQDTARLARRTLIEDWARDRGIHHVLTGHTADDQAETVLMRLARGSGVDGLAGIAARERHVLTWLRPLLEQRRADLRRYLADRNVTWAEDPSNDDPRFDRVRARTFLAGENPLGLTVPRLVETARHMRAAQAVLDDAMRSLAETAVEQDGGDLLFDGVSFRTAAGDTRTRLLAAALCWVSGIAHRPRFSPLKALSDGLDGTLHGCRLCPDGPKARLTREEQAVRETRSRADAIWDNRWQFDGPLRDRLEIRALGPGGIAQLPKDLTRTRPLPALHADPAVWQGDTLVAAPLAGWPQGWTARLIPGRNEFHGSLFAR